MTEIYIADLLKSGFKLHIGPTQLELTREYMAEHSAIYAIHSTPEDMITHHILKMRLWPHSTFHEMTEARWEVVALMFKTCREYHGLEDFTIVYNWFTKPDYTDVVAIAVTFPPKYEQYQF